MKKFILLAVVAVVGSFGVSAKAADELAGFDLKSISAVDNAVIEASREVNIDDLAKNAGGKEEAVEACFRRCGFYGGCHNSCYNYNYGYNNCYHNCYSSCYTPCYSSCYTPCYTQCQTYTYYQPVVTYQPVTYTTYSTCHTPCYSSCNYWGCGGGY